MPTHVNAVGYLNDLAKEIDEDWFKMICDLVTVSGSIVFDKAIENELFVLFDKRASYIGIKSAAAAATISAPKGSPDVLEYLSAFRHFKLLGSELNISFNKQITLVFGTNGSGKSSLCESLKVLASTQPPTRPLENVRTSTGGVPAFQYKFKSDTSHQSWSPSSGYGPRHTTVKYFDTSIAIKNVTSAVEPGRVIELTPFKLHIFAWAKTLTTNFRESLQEKQTQNASLLARELEAVRTTFAKFKGSLLSMIDESTASALSSQIRLGEEFKDEALLQNKQLAATELEKATSDEGLKLLRAEHQQWEIFLDSVRTLTTAVENLWAIGSEGKMKLLDEKRAAQEVLAKALVPNERSLDEFLPLLRAASQICAMENAIGLACPLCKRVLGVPEVSLFTLYHNLLIGDLEKEIEALRFEVATAARFATAAANVDREVWVKYATIPTEKLEQAKTISDVVLGGVDPFREPETSARDALEQLKALVQTWSADLDLKKNAIDAFAKGCDELSKQLAQLRKEIAPLEYAKAISTQLDQLKVARRRAQRAALWEEKLPIFTQVLKRITERAKVAHEDLLVADFEKRLDSEYKALAERDMKAFGVSLARRGAEASVTVIPFIGGRAIEGVLSEGEQRIHALALFFAELETCTQSVVVFDDPVSSFDYNYIANYSLRLRDFAVNHPTRQIVVLTHNWDFFAQLQITLNNASLANNLAVHVLENCTVIADYSEKTEDLKVDISTILGMSTEPSKAKKEELAGKMRRLIEAVVNTHVFNNQRHQYKQKSLPVSTFNCFTKLVALLPDEATLLRDLYSKLSIAEHDDPRNSYVSIDKSMFQTRYNQILAIECAVKARKP